MQDVADPTAVIVPLEQLGTLGRELGRGGQASVFALPQFTLADAPGELVYKRYHVAPVSDADLRKVVSLRGRLDPASRDRLDGIAPWPCRVVTHAGSTVGVVMPRIPESYTDTLHLPSGAVKQSLREVLNLFAPVERVRRVGRPVPTQEERLRVCRDFAVALSFMHDELDVVFGDINAKNELWQLGAGPKVMFLDCDAVRPRGAVAGTRQLNAPDWDPPEGGDLTRRTDLYKLGLFILRALTPGLQASARRDPRAARDVLDMGGLDLLTRAVGAVPSARPEAREWTVHLSRMLGDPVAPPSLVKAEPDRAFVLTGHPVEIRWEATDAAWIEVISPGGIRKVSGAPGAGVVAFVPGATCSVLVRAGNDHGTDERAVGPITVVPLPVQRLLDVPMPQLAWQDLGLLRPPPHLPSPPLPVVGRLPAAPDAVGLVTVEPGRPRHQPVAPPPLRSARFPFDLIGLVTTAPDLHPLFEELP